MPQEYLVGVDVGTCGSKGVLTDLSGRVLSYKFVEHGVDSPKPGWYEQDADEVWWGDLRRITRALIADAHVDPQEVAAVGLSALCPDVLPVDDAGRPLRKAILYSDTRAAEEAKRMTRELGEVRIFEACGNRLSVQSAGPKVLWLRDHEPRLFEVTQTIHSASSYLVYRLTGETVFDYGTASSFHPLFNIHDLQWDEGICRDLRLPTRILPSTCWATKLVGVVTSQASKDTGLAEGTPVIAGTVDGFAEDVSVGVVEKGQACLVYGTTMAVFVKSGQPGCHPNVISSPGPIPGSYLTGAYMNTSGALTRWFRDNFAQIERESERILGISAYQLLSDEVAEIPPGSLGLVVLPYFAGEGYPILDDDARGLVIGLTLSHTRNHVYKGLLEGVAYGLRHNLETMEGAGTFVGRIVSIGGGTRSRVWTQIVSDVTGRDQELAASPYGAPYGDAYLAGYGTGLFRDLRPLQEEWVRTTGKIQHDPQRKRIYDRYYEVYRNLYPCVAQSMHALASLSRQA